MKTKIVLWGRDDNEARTIVALELRPDENKVDLWVFPAELSTDELNKQLLFEWRDNKLETFPEGATHQELDLTVSEPLLPENIKVEKPDIIQRAQSEWHFIILSSKLNAAYQSELGDLKDRIEKLEAYDQSVWDNLKTFWNKVQGQVRERNLFRDHSNKLRDTTNGLFNHLKTLRSKVDEEFRTTAKANYDTMMGTLDKIEERVNKNEKLQSAFEELKKLQRSFRDTKLTREYRNKVWERLDKTFKAVKEKRFGPQNNSTSPLDRLQRRYDGLVKALGRMNQSIKRDKEDLTFQTKKINSVETGQLEAQIREAKIKMIEGRISSKEEKLNEMNTTKLDLEKKIELQKVRDEKRAEQQRLAEAKAAAKAKAEEKIRQEAKAREGDAKIAAAAAITGKEVVDTPQAEPMAGSLIEDGKSLLEKAKDVLNTVAEEVSEKAAIVSDVIEDKAKDAMEAVGLVDEKTTGETVVEELKEEAKEAVTEDKAESKGFFERAKDMLEDVAEEVSEKAAMVSDVIEDKAKDAMEAVGLVDEKTTGETVVEELKEEAKEAVKEETTEEKSFFDKAKDALNTVAEEVSEKAAIVSDVIEDKAKDAMEAVGLADEKTTGETVVEELKEEAKETVAEDKTEVKSFFERAKDMLEDVAEDVSEKVSNISEVIEDKAMDAMSNVAKNVDDVKDKITGKDDK